MRVQMLQDPSAETFSKQLLDIGDGKVAIDETGYVKLPTDFCTIADSQDTLIEQIFPDVHTQTATAGSDVVQSGRPIFDDFFLHLWPYIGNNTANVVFQMVKHLWLIRIDQ
ncbi:ATP-dependent DNA helicase [Trichonephila clavipes]|nr:ATP-dependent DNA helicase [Trichonephila clavipes]